MNVLLVLDLLLVVVAGGLWVAAWPLRGARAGAAVLIAAVLATAARATVVALLGGAGWWFVPDRLVTTIPLTLRSGVVAVTMVRRRTPPAPVMIAAAYVPVAGIGMQFLVGNPVTTPHPPRHPACPSPTCADRAARRPGRSPSPPVPQRSPCRPA